MILLFLNNYCFWKYRGKGCPYSGLPVSDANDSKFTGSLVNKGAWATEQSYSTNDFVFLDIEDGNDTRKVVFVCIEAHQSSSEKKPSINTQYWSADQCSKTLKACRDRFKGDDIEQLPFGGFPGSRVF